MPDKNKLFRDFVAEIMKHRTEKVQRLAFLEKDDENVPLVMQQMLDAGVTEFLVMPMLLFPAMHATEDIPAQVEAALEGTGATYYQADCFGDRPEVYQVALQRIEGLNADTYFITAHGNKRFAEPDVRLHRMVAEMDKLTDQHLEAAMLYGELNFRRMIKEVSPQKRIVIMPYFLFDGHLVRKIKRLCEPLKAEGYDIQFTETLDLDMRMVQAVLDKLQEADALCIR